MNILPALFNAVVQVISSIELSQGKVEEKINLHASVFRRIHSAKNIPGNRALVVLLRACVTDELHRF